MLKSFTPLVAESEKDLIELENAQRARLGQLFARGDAVLFTGAGFSRTAKSPDGQLVAGVEDLREALWPLAFGDAPLDANSTLGDTYAVAVRQARNATRDVLERRLRVHPDSLPDAYRVWFSMPWLRAWTLNIDDLESAVSRRFRFERRIVSHSALSDPLPLFGGDLLVVHLNGDLDDFPECTFSQRQYGERTATPDPWYSHLVSDIMARPVIFVGTQLDEPSLWQHMAMRGRRGSGGRERRPGSFLISPSLPVAREAMLEDFNIQWIRGTAEDFATDVLADFVEEAARGVELLRQRAERVGGPPPVQRVTDLMTKPHPGNPAEFLLGEEPSWADLAEGYAVVRDFESALRDEIAERGAGQIVTITGTAGSGKSVTLMRLALGFQADGKEVVWIDTNQELPLWQVREAVRQAKADVVAIDNVDSLGEATPRFLKELLQGQEGLVILGASRSTRYVQLRMQESLADVNAHQFTVPHLEDADIELLIGALDRAKRLGRLRGLSHEERVIMFRKSAGRQLLVAMVEATSGERFDEKVARECSELTAGTALVYSIVSLATNLREYVTKDELLIALGSATNMELNDIEQLLQQRLLVEQSGQIRVRHRYIADRAVDYFHHERQLGEPLRGLMFAMASKVNAESGRHSRPKRFLVKVLNHDLWLRLADVATARAAYQDVQTSLSWDSHFWLQRGSLEVEVGDLHHAENFLDQARGLARDDPFVETEWAYMNFKRAAQDASAPGSDERAEEAIEALEDAISRRGRSDPYPFHVLGSQGLSWIRRAPMPRERRIQLLAHFRELLRQGVRWHPYREELRGLYKDVDGAYLSMSVVEERDS